MTLYKTVFWHMKAQLSGKFEFYVKFYFRRYLFIEFSCRFFYLLKNGLIVWNSTTTPQITRWSSFFQLEFNENCDNFEYLQSCLSLSTRPRKNKIITCRQLFAMDISFTKTSTTRMKKQKVIAEINNLGYTFDNSDTKVTLRFYNSEYKLNNRFLV